MKKQIEQPLVKLKSSRYQPNKADMNCDIRIDTSPNLLAQAVGEKVSISLTPDAASKRAKL